jgi:hypothetical protein
VCYDCSKPAGARVLAFAPPASYCECAVAVQIDIELSEIPPSHLQFVGLPHAKLHLVFLAFMEQITDTLKHAVQSV